MSNSPISRRLLLQAGAAGAAGLAVAFGGTSLRTPSASAAVQGTTTVTDLGPAVLQFSLMSAVLIGDTVYIGSRNLEPTRVIAYHLPTRKVVGETVLGHGHSVQTLTADPTGRYVYAGVLHKANGQPNLFQVDVTKLGTPARAAQIGDRDVRDIAVAPDGRVYAVGGGGTGAPAPALWEFDPTTGQVSNLGIPDTGATLARAVAATDTTVFFGAGSSLGGGASRACLHAYDRATKVFTNATPAEMANDPSIRDILIVDDKVVATSAASLEESKVAAINLADLTDYAVATSVGKTAKNLARDGDHVYFANESGLMMYNLATNAVGPVDFDGPALGEVWGVDCRAGKVIVTSAFGFIAEIDPAAKTSVITDLGEAGAPADPQTVMGIAAGGGYVYVGGTGTIARHTLAGGPVVNMRAPGEAKDAMVVGNVLYTCQYSSQGIWRYVPGAPGPEQVANYPAEQNRPLDICFDKVNQLVLAGAQSDTEGGGSLWTYHRATNRQTHFINPIDNQQLVRAVATREGVVYLGGDNTFPTGPRSTVVAFDPVAGKELWRIDPQQTAGIAALATQGKYLYALSRKGGLVIIDVTRRTVAHRADITSVCTGFAAMTTNRGVVYGVSDKNVFRFDPHTFAVSVVVPGINGGWYSGSHITNDELGRLYTMRGRNLVQIDDYPTR